MTPNPIVTVEKRDGYSIVFYEPGFGCSWPTERYGVRLPSGMVHPERTERDARRSPYWPFAS